jgi:hypothetical protein
MLRVYVAGAYSADNVIDVLGNMRRGISLSCEVLAVGMAPFCPWLDFLFGLNRHFDIDYYYRYSMAWLKAADAVLVVQEGKEESKGTGKELQTARALGIPVFHSFKDLILWKRKECGAKERNEQLEESGKKCYEGGHWSEFNITRDTDFKQILREMAELHDKKESDYGTEGDPLANIRGSERFDVPAWISCEVRLNDKQQRIHNFIRKRELANESVEDSLLDRAVYSVIALQLYREQKEKEK